MTCHRCDGLMVRERYDKLEFDSAGYEISGWLPSPKTLAFNFIDITNLAQPTDAHRHKALFTFQDQDHFSPRRGC